MDLAEQFQVEGYVVIRGILTAPRVERLRAICDGVLGQWRAKDPQSGEPQDVNTTCMRHLNHPAYFLDDADAAGGVRGFCELMDAVADPAVVGVTRELIGAEPLFRCTSLFMNPGNARNDGDWHRDSQFTEADESAERRLIERPHRTTGGVQMQIALIPSDDAEYVPRSHVRWDTPEEYAIRRADGCAHATANDMPGALRVALKPGDAVIFDPCGLHRGRYHSDKPRRTLMLTYTPSGNAPFDYFTDQPWFLEAGHLDPLKPATRAFFERFVETFRERWLEKAAVPA